MNIQSTPEEKKELATIKSQTTKLVKVAPFKIEGQKQLNLAVEYLKKLNEVAKKVKEKKESIIKPLSTALKNARLFFAEFETPLQETILAVKSRIYDYNLLIEEQSKQKEAEITKKVENGDMSMKAGGAKLAKIEEKKDAIPTRILKEVVIVDEAKVPKEFWVIDMITLRRQALMGKVIPGVEVRDKKIIVNQ